MIIIISRFLSSGSFFRLGFASLSLSAAVAVLLLCSALLFATTAESRREPTSTKQPKECGAIFIIISGLPCFYYGLLLFYGQLCIELKLSDCRITRLFCRRLLSLETFTEETGIIKVLSFQQQDGNYSLTVQKTRS